VEGLGSKQVYFHLVLNQLIIGQVSDKPDSKVNYIPNSHQSMWEVVRESVHFDTKYAASRTLIILLIALQFLGQLEDVGSGSLFSQAEGAEIPSKKNHGILGITLRISGS